MTGYWTAWGDWNFCMAVCSWGNAKRTRNFSIFPGSPPVVATDADFCQYDQRSCDMTAYCPGNLDIALNIALCML